MSDKKPADNEIKKALECCVGDNDGKNCFDCPLWEIDDCQEQLLLDALDIINRPQAKVIKEQNKNSKLWNERNSLQAEVERLETENKLFVIYKGQRGFGKAFFFRELEKQIKAEAYKEFAERLKEWFRKESEVYKLIDNLLKELVGEDK